jgi:hypothetical protein
MGRSYRGQESRAKLCFLEMLCAGICTFSLRPYASGYELMPRGSTRLCSILDIHLNKPNLSRC